MWSQNFWYIKTRACMHWHLIRNRCSGSSWKVGATRRRRGQRLKKNSWINCTNGVRNTCSRFLLSKISFRTLCCSVSSSCYLLRLCLWARSFSDVTTYFLLVAAAKGFLIHKTGERWIGSPVGEELNTLDGCGRSMCKAASLGMTRNSQRGVWVIGSASCTTVR